MANALKEAPLKKVNGDKEQAALDMEFDVAKKYVFTLAARNLEREKPVMDGLTGKPIPHEEFKPFQNLVMTSQIVWNKARVGIRYYDGCESIFISEQPKEKDLIDQLIQQTKRRHFLKGKLIVEGYEKMLLMFLFICGWNTESGFRTNTANDIFYPENPDKKADAEATMLDEQEAALRYAKEATETKMLIHASFLGIPTTDYHSGNDLSPKAMRTEYRKAALRDPKKFIESYGNTKIEVKYYIDKALIDRTINNKMNVNKVAWKSGTEICDISGLRSNEAIADKLFEYSQTEEGAEFTVQLKALYSN